MKKCLSCGGNCGGTKKTGCLDGTVEYTYEIISVGKYWIESGWYTLEQLKALVVQLEIMNKQARDLMQQVKGKNHD